MRELSANGLRFACLEEGTGPLVLLLHGFPDTAYTWDLIRPAIAKAGFRVVAPFLRGYAPSEIASGAAYDSDTLGRDVLALISALGEARAIVIGHDWGASAAYSAASLGPEKIELLVTTAIPHPASIPLTPRNLWIGRHFLSLRRSGAEQMVRANDFQHVDELVHRWSPTWEVPPGETARVKAAFREPGCLDAALGYYRAVGLRQAPSLRKKISVPTVAFAGDSDLLPQIVWDRAATWFTGSYRVVRMPGGHFMHREHPDVFLRELLPTLAARA